MNSSNNINASTNSSGLKRKLNDVCGSPNKSKRNSHSFYVKLAAESPIKVEESSDELYGSANERETDFAQDTEDYSSSCSDSDISLSSNLRAGSHIIEAYGQRMTVIEYEVASDSQTSDCFLFSESSSGTEGMMEAMIYGSLKRTVDVDSSSSKEFPILAETTDDSVDCSDPEFTLADFWKCVRCKNKQNNPMYRYCEKCYRLRKSLFPPRPKSKKKKKKNLPISKNSTARPKRTSLSSRSSYSSSDENSNHSLSPSPSQSSKTPSEPSIRYSTIAKIDKKTASNLASSPSHHNINNNTNPLTSNKNVKRKREELEEEPDIDSEKPSKLLKEVDSGHGSCSSQDLMPQSDTHETSASECEKQIENEGLLSPALSQHSIGSAATEPIHSGDEQDWPPSDSDAGFSRNEDDDIDEQEDDQEIQEIRVNNRVSATDSGLSQTSEVGLCAICRTEERNAAFVHRRFVHFCACYRCAVKSWSENKNCPICFGKVSNVVKVFIQ